MPIPAPTKDSLVSGSGVIGEETVGAFKADTSSRLEVEKLGTSLAQVTHRDAQRVSIRVSGEGIGVCFPPHVGSPEAPVEELSALGSQNIHVATTHRDRDNAGCFESTSLMRRP